MCWNTWWAKEKEFLYITVFSYFSFQSMNHHSFTRRGLRGQETPPVCARTEVGVVCEIIIFIFRTVPITYSFSCWETFPSVAAGKISLRQQVAFISGQSLLLHHSIVWLFVTPWTVVCQAPLFKQFSRQEYWSGLPFPSPGDLPNPGAEPMSVTLAGRFLPTEPPGKPLHEG